jgi:hypothetical protein
MATRQSNSKGKGSGDLGWSDPVRNRVDVGSSNSNKNESDVSIVIVICLAIMALTFVLAIPLLGMAYLDMHNATVIAVEEIKKMRELRARILQGE